MKRNFPEDDSLGHQYLDPKIPWFSLKSVGAVFEKSRICVQIYILIKNVCLVI